MLNISVSRPIWRASALPYDQARMKAARFLLLLAPILMLGAPSPVSAQISLSITTEVDSAKLPDLSVVASVTNEGKETAHQLRTSIAVGTAKIAIPGVQEL